MLTYCIDRNRSFPDAWELRRSAPRIRARRSLKILGSFVPSSLHLDHLSLSYLAAITSTMKVSRRRPSSSDASNDAIVERVNNANAKSSQSTSNTHYSPLENEKAFRVASDEKKGRTIWTYVGLALILVAALVLVAPWSGERSSNSLKPRSHLPEDVATSVVREADSPSSSIGPAASSNNAVQLKIGKARQEDDVCFPLRSGLASTSGPPGLSRDEWWCKDSELYGFLGER